jgi:hypothetical protein
MSDNKYMDKLEKSYDPKYASFDATRAMALIKELQILNEILNELVQVGPGGDRYISVAISE